MTTGAAAPWPRDLGSRTGAGRPPRLSRPMRLRLLSIMTISSTVPEGLADLAADIEARDADVAALNLVHLQELTPLPHVAQPEREACANADPDGGATRGAIYGPREGGPLAGPIGGETCGYHMTCLSAVGRRRSALPVTPIGAGLAPIGVTGFRGLPQSGLRVGAGAGGSGRSEDLRLGNGMSMATSAR